MNEHWKRDGKYLTPYITMHIFQAKNIQQTIKSNSVDDNSMESKILHLDNIEMYQDNAELFMRNTKCSSSNLLGY